MMNSMTICAQCRQGQGFLNAPDVVREASRAGQEGRWRPVARRSARNHERSGKAHREGPPYVSLLIRLVASWVLWTGLMPFSAWAASSDQPSSPPTVPQQAEQFFQQLQRQEQPPPPRAERQSSRTDAPPNPSSGGQASGGSTSYPPEHFLTATGQGDLSKGRLVCQRVSEIAARAELAKQIRVFVQEHAVDRVRERTGQPVEQDLEVVREETVRELLQDVKIVDRLVDETAGVCSSVAVMPKSRVTPQPVSDPAAGPQTTR